MAKYFFSEYLPKDTKLFIQGNCTYLLYKQYYVSIHDVSLPEITKLINCIDEMTWTPKSNYISKTVVWC